MRKPTRLKGESLSGYYERACKLLYTNGYNINEIAAKMKLTNTEVFNYTHDGIHYLTKEECERIVDMHNKGLSTTSIAKEMNVARDTIRRKINEKANAYDEYENGDPMKDAYIEAIKDLYSKGKSTQKIADELGLTEHRVRYRLIKCGLYVPAGSSKVSSKEIAKFKRLRKQGLSYKEIGKRCGRNKDTVSHYLNK